MAQLDEFFAFVSDENGEERILCAKHGRRPMMARDRESVEEFRPLVEQEALATGLRIRLVRFARAEVIDTIDRRQ